MTLQQRFALGLWALATIGSISVHAQPLNSPKQGVLCDQYVCADKNGVSPSLTGNYLDQTRAIVNDNHTDESQFTFSDGTFCDTNEQICYQDRYFNSDGSRGAINQYATQRLFN
jgi:hypothetical protein